jgi:hypothetical protein
VDVFKNVEEWYDPFSELKKHMNTKRGIVAHNMPKDAVFVDNLPQNIIKK